MGIKVLKKIIISATIGLTGAFIAACDSGQWQTAEGAAWATTYHIVYKGTPELCDSIQTIIDEVNRSLSPFVENSLVSRINRNETSDIDSLFKKVFDISQNVNTMSDGAFDPTVAPAINLWGFGYKTDNVEPDSENVDSVKQLVGIGDCMIQEGKLKKKSAATEFNFSAIAKGYGCDMIGEMFRRNGVENYMIEIGGEIAVAGHNSTGTDWNIMIVTPEQDSGSNEPLVVHITDCGMATSGNYRNFRDTESGRIGHTIDPSTCRPVDNKVFSATVIAKNTIFADAIATACMVLPPHKALEMAEKAEDVELLLIANVNGEKYEYLMTDGFKRYINGN
ncbi:MAG: FAD:protein FMN transferase [Paramuribaculum sp.]|nr:FAD:protein FMN transferase [Paramuribaculum sp.]